MFDICFYNTNDGYALDESPPQNVGVYKLVQVKKKYVWFFVYGTGDISLNTAKKEYNVIAAFSRKCFDNDNYRDYKSFLHELNCADLYCRFFKGDLTRGFKDGH